MKEFIVFILLCSSAFLEEAPSSGDQGQESKNPSSDSSNEFEDWCVDEASIKFTAVEFRDLDLLFNAELLDKTKIAFYSTENSVKIHKYEVSKEFPQYPDLVPFGTAKSVSEVPTGNTSVTIPGHGPQKMDTVLAFINEFFFEKVKDGKLFLTGLNQQWLGCPMPLCIYAMLDSAYTLSNGSTYLVRGRHIWDLAKPPLSKNAMLFAEANSEIPLHTDWAFVFQKEKYFGQGKQVVCQTEDHKPCKGLAKADGSSKKSDVWNVFQAKEFAPNTLVQAGFAIEKEVFLMHITVEGDPMIRRFEKTSDGEAKRFEDSTKTADKATRDKRFMIKHGLLQNGVDAAFTKDNQVYFLSRNLYLNLNVEKVKEFSEDNPVSNWFEGVNEELINEKGLLNCPDDIYTNQKWIISRPVYKQNFPKLYESGQTEDSVQDVLKILKAGRPTPAPVQNEWVTSYLPILLGVILTAVLVIVVAIIVTERRRRIKKRLRLIKLRKHGLVDNRTGAKGGVGAHRSHLDDDILGDTYTPGKKLKTVAIRQSGAQSQMSSTDASRMGSKLTSSAGKTPSSTKMVGSRALDQDWNFGSKVIMKKGFKGGPLSKASSKV